MGLTKSEIFTEEEIKRILPILQNVGSDSTSLDNMFEFLLANGVDFFKAARSLVPAPWQNAPHMDSNLRAFYEYTATAMEAWDGPAAVSLTDGRHIGCLIDRNGLRPSKYVITKDDKLYITSEYGTLNIEDSNILERGRLQSGQMIALDLKHGKILKEQDINDYLKSSQHYSTWLNDDMDYIQEPDIFHEIVGHCPLLTHPAFAAFNEAYGKLGLEASKEERVFLARMYWFTIEFGLVGSTPSERRIYGGGILSSPSETIYALSGDPEYREFDLIDVLRTPYRIDHIQPIYYVIDDLDRLFDIATSDVRGYVKKAMSLGLFEPVY